MSAVCGQYSRHGLHAVIRRTIIPLLLGVSVLALLFFLVGKESPENSPAEVPAIVQPETPPDGTKSLVGEQFSIRKARQGNHSNSDSTDLSFNIGHENQLERLKFPNGHEEFDEYILAIAESWPSEKYIPTSFELKRELRRRFRKRTQELTPLETLQYATDLTERLPNNSFSHEGVVECLQLRLDEDTAYTALSTAKTTNSDVALSFMLHKLNSIATPSGCLVEGLAEEVFSLRTNRAKSPWSQLWGETCIARSYDQDVIDDFIAYSVSYDTPERTARFMRSVQQSRDIYNTHPFRKLSDENIADTNVAYDQTEEFEVILLEQFRPGMEEERAANLVRALAKIGSTEGIKEMLDAECWTTAFTEKLKMAKAKAQKRKEYLNRPPPDKD